MIVLKEFPILIRNCTEFAAVQLGIINNLDQTDSIDIQTRVLFRKRLISYLREAEGKSIS